MDSVLLTTQDKKDIYGYAHIILRGTIRDGEEKCLIEFVKKYDDDDATKRLIVIINIFKANLNNIKVQVDAICDKHLIKNLPLMCYILKYLIRSEGNLKMLMEQMYEEKEEMDNGTYVMGCDMLKAIYKHRDMILSEKIVVNLVKV